MTRTNRYYLEYSLIVKYSDPQQHTRLTCDKHRVAIYTKRNKIHLQLILV